MHGPGPPRPASVTSTRPPSATIRPRGLSSPVAITSIPVAPAPAGAAVAGAADTIRAAATARHSTGSRFTVAPPTGGGHMAQHRDDPTLLNVYKDRTLRLR